MADTKWEVLQNRIYKLESLLWHAIHKNHPLSPSGCTPCEEIDKAMTDYVARGAQ